MVKIFYLSFIFILMVSTGCNRFYNMAKLEANTPTIIKVGKQMLIEENTCRGCAYQSTTAFYLQDENNIVRIKDIITIDKNSKRIIGGSVLKNIVITANKPGKTFFKLYKIYSKETAAKDSLNYKTYEVEVIE